MNKSKLLSFIIVSFFLLSVITTVNAAQNDTQTTDQITDNTQNTNTNIEENTNAKVNQKSSKNIEIQKISDSIKTGNQNIKVATKKQTKKDTTLDVNNYQQLTDVIENINQQTTTETHTINLHDGDYTIINPITITNTTPQNIIINGNNQKIDGTNTKQFLTITPTITLTINNLIIVNTNAQNASAIKNNGNLTLNNITIQNNTALDTSIIMSTNANLTIINSDLSNNKAVNIGGVTYNNNTTINIINSTLNNNTASKGGVNYIYESNMVIYNSTFNNNFATNASVNYNIQYSNLTINKSQFNHNQAELDGGVNFNANNSDIHMFNSNFSFNNATYGGVVHNNNTGTITIKNSTFTNNGAMYGGVICNYGIGDIIIENSLFLNSNGMYGGVNYNDKGNIYFRNIYSANNTGTYGGENYNHDGFISIENSAFQNNTGRRIGGVNYNFGNSRMVIKNSTFKNTQLIPSEGSIGGIDVCGGVNYNYVGSIMNITDSSFINNTSNSSGGVLYNMGEMNINNSIFTNNKAIKNGSAIYNMATLNITNSNFTNNFGMYNESIYTTQHMTLINNTIVNEIPTIVDQNTPLNSPILEVPLNTPVTYIIENNSITISKNASNIITTTHTFTTNQTITIPINYPAYRANNTNIELIVIPARLNQTINPIINTPQTTLNNLTITATLKDQNNNNITQQQPVTIKINGVTQKQLTINNGQLETTVDTTNFTSKNYIVTIIVGDTTRYNKVEYTQNLEIINRNATINLKTNTPEVLGQLVVNVTLKDTNTSTREISNGFIIYKINGCTLRNADGSEIRTIVTHSTSQLIFNIPETIGKGTTYNITAKYISSYYNRVENITFNLTITPKTIVNSTLKSITTTQKQNTTLNLTIKDEYGDVITGRIYSVVKINGVTYNRTYIEDGKLNVVLDTESFINPKYIITIKTGPSPLYTQAEFNMILNIVKSDTTQTNTTKNIKTTNITTYNVQQINEKQQ